MKPLTSRPSTRTFVLGALALVGLSACQSLVTATSLSELLGPLDQALSEPTAQVERRAVGGDGQAQLAMAIIVAHGLYGETPNKGAALHWRTQALQNRRFMPITQYTAAFNGAPSRINIINVAVPTFPIGQLETVDRCVAWLAGDLAISPSVCGAVVDAERRKAAWREAVPH